MAHPPTSYFGALPRGVSGPSDTAEGPNAEPKQGGGLQSISKLAVALGLWLWTNCGSRLLLAAVVLAMAFFFDCVLLCLNASF